jgi:hypothetical protein
MTFDYTAAAETARSLLRLFGATLTLTRTIAGGYDPATGVTSPDVTQTQTALVALLPYKDGDYLEGTVRAGDRRAIIEAASGFAPDALTKLTDAAGAVWQLENVAPLAPAGEVVIYKANATR